nr:MAG TPA: hypothetical protein [Caudoviricetes sp.]
MRSFSIDVQRVTIRLFNVEGLQGFIEGLEIVGGNAEFQHVCTLCNAPSAVK